jgi:ABC-type amino acid transport substrate-binding protein
MKNRFLIALILLVLTGKTSADNDTLHVYYLENFPYSYTENKVPKGIEIEIINEFVGWMKTDGIDLIVNYTSFVEFDKLFDAVKKGRSNVIGLGSVTINAERLKQVSFSPPYLKNVSILISNSHIPTIAAKKEISGVFAHQRAITLKNSTYEKYLKDLKKNQLPKLSINYTDSEFSAIDSVANNKNVFAYCDILSYWSYTRNHKNKFIKIQKIFTFDSDNLGFIIPKNSVNVQALSEFFESGFGFISTKKYTEILEKHLSYEVIESVRVN